MQTSYQNKVQSPQDKCNDAIMVNAPCQLIRKVRTRLRQTTATTIIYVQVNQEMNVASANKIPSSIFSTSPTLIFSASRRCGEY